MVSTSIINSARAQKLSYIRKCLVAISVVVDELIEAAAQDALAEDATGARPPLNAEQLRKRNERDAGRQERIAKITSTASEKVSDIRRKMGK